MRAIAAWLKENGLEQHAQTFAAAGINLLVQLPSLTDVILRQIGIPNQDHAKILAASAELKRRSDARLDLVRRFVAVAISVGFAGFLVKMAWLSNGSVPSLREWEQLIRLFTALFVILLGWEWHNKDLAAHQITTIPRLLIDVLVVVASLLFLISSERVTLWLFVLVAIFFLYV